MCSIMNDVIQMVSEGKCGILVMLDLSAAFDTVVHEYLLNDLKFIGINGSAYRWFESYLQNRSHSGCFTEQIGNKEINKRSTTGKCFGSHIVYYLYN